MKQRGEPGSFSNAAGMLEAKTRDELQKLGLVDIARFQPIDGCKGSA
jgi:hypothetical protein